MTERRFIIIWQSAPLRGDDEMISQMMMIFLQSSEEIDLGHRAMKISPLLVLVLDLKHEIAEFLS